MNSIDRNKIREVQVALSGKFNYQGMEHGIPRGIVTCIPCGWIGSSVFMEVGTAGLRISCKNCGSEEWFK